MHGATHIKVKKFLQNFPVVDLETAQANNKCVCVCVCACPRVRMYSYQFWPAFYFYSQKESSNKTSPDDVIMTRFAELYKSLVWHTDVCFHLCKN